LRCREKACSITEREKITENAVAVPTGSVAAATLVAAETDIVICLNLVTGPSFAVASAFEYWHDLSDREVALQLSRVEETGFF
jgi:putative phosphoribosyl transferase